MGKDKILRQFHIVINKNKDVAFGLHDRPVAGGGQAGRLLAYQPHTPFLLGRFQELLGVFFVFQRLVDN